MQTKLSPTEDLDMAHWCARVTLATKAHTKRGDALHLLLNHLLQRTDNEDARVLIQAAMDCVVGEQSQEMLEALLKHLAPQQRPKIGILASSIPHPQHTVASTTLEAVETKLETFRSATRLAATALSMAPKTPEAKAFACGLNAFMRQFKGEQSRASQVVVVALQFLQGEQPRQELERHVQAACKAFNEMRHDAEPDTKREKL